MGPTINGLRYSGSCPFPQTPIPLRFFDGLAYRSVALSLPQNPYPVGLFEVPCGICLLGQGVNNQRLTIPLIISLPPNPHPVEVFRCALMTINLSADDCPANNPLKGCCPIRPSLPPAP